MGWKRVVFIGEPAMVKKVLTGDPESFEKLHWEKYVLAPVMEGGLIILNGEVWKNHHRTINTFFTSEMYILMCKEAAEAVAKVWPQTIGNDHIKLQTEFRMLGSEILSKLIFGWSFYDAGMLRSFVETIELLNYDLEERAKDLLKLRPWVAPFEVARAQKAKKAGEAQLLAIIREARAKREAEPKQPNKFRYLIDIMLDDNDFTELDILHEVKTLFGASETTVHLMTWCMYELSKNPIVDAKLQDEIQGIQGELTIEKISQCTYLTAVINESLRMFPPAPAMFRQAAHDMQLDDTIRVDKGAILAISPFFIHKDPRYWESPETFMPERFLAPSSTTEWNGDNINNPAYLPFGSGKRQCIGKRFSLIESGVMLVSLLRKYRYSAVPNQIIEPCTDILNRPRYGIEMYQEYRVVANNGADVGQGAC